MGVSILFLGQDDPRDTKVRTGTFLENRVNVLRSLDVGALSLGGSYVESVEMCYIPTGRLERKIEMCGSAI